MILYIPLFRDIFGLVPLDFNEWMLILKFSFPVIIIDEILKLFARNYLKNKHNTKLKQE